MNLGPVLRLLWRLDPISTAPIGTPRSRILGALLEIFTARDRTIALLALALTAYYVATPGIYQGKASGDGYFGFMYLPSAVYHHSLDIAPTVPEWIPYLGHEKTGHVPNACPIGPVVFWLPTYLLGLGIETVQRWLAHARMPAQPGQSVLDFWMAGLGSLWAGLAGIALVFRLLQRKLGVWPARVGTVAATLATSIAWYLVTQPLYQHACAFFAVSLLVERWDAYRSRGPLGPRACAVLGLAGGLAMTMRLQEGIWLLLPGLDLLATLVAALRANETEEKNGHDLRLAGRQLLGGLALAACALAAFAPQLWLWHWLFGFIRPPQPPGHMRWLDPALVATLFSIRGGMLAWTPIFYLLVPGLIAGRKPLDGLAWRLALLFAIELWVNAAAWDHWGSWTYGSRRFSDATVTLAAALGGLWWWVARRRERAVVAAVLVACVAWNVMLMELVRQKKIKSSGAGTFPISTWIGWAKGPAWLGAAVDRIGWPFTQPAGLLWSALYRVPPRTFDGVVGSYFLERDSRIHSVVQTPTLTFADPGQYVPEGLSGPPDKDRSVAAGPRVRVLIPLFAKEPIQLQLSGSFHERESEIKAAWNGTPIAVFPSRNRVRIEVPQALVHTRSWVNQLTLDLPPESRLRKLDFESLGTWWQ